MVKVQGNIIKVTFHLFSSSIMFPYYSYLSNSAKGEDNDVEDAEKWVEDGDFANLSSSWQLQWQFN